MVEVDRNYASKGQANLNTVLGSLGTAGFVGNMLPILGGILGGGCNGWNGVCSENMPVSRYELEKESKISELQSQLALRDANTYNDQKILELYKFFDGELRAVRSELGAQAVTNQKTADSFALAAADLAATKRELHDRIQLETERRCCADNAIKNYVNATFYPKMVADVTVGTETTAQPLYNPIPDCGCCCGK